MCVVYKLTDLEVCIMCYRNPYQWFDITYITYKNMMNFSSTPRVALAFKNHVK